MHPSLYPSYFEEEEDDFSGIDMSDYEVGGVGGVGSVGGDGGVGGVGVNFFFFFFRVGRRR